MNQGEALERILRTAGEDFTDGIVTSGTTLTMVDSTIATKYNDNKFKGWVIFISISASGPQNQYQVVSANTNSSGTVTWTTAMTSAPNAGDQYAICKPTIPIYTLIKFLNDGLARFYYPDEDTSITTASQKLEYVLPVGVTGYTLRKVEIQSIINITNVNYWYETSDWRVDPHIGGTQDTLVFTNQPTPLRTIKLTLAKPHPKLAVYSDAISAYLDDDLVITMGVERVMYWRKIKGKNKKNDVSNWMDAKSDYDNQVAANKVRLPQRGAKFLSLGNANVRR